MKTISKTSAYLLAAFLAVTGPLASAGETSPWNSGFGYWQNGGAGGHPTDRSTIARDYRPESDIEHPEDVGIRAHTTLRVLIPPGGLEAFNPESAASITPFGLPPYKGYFYETPASFGCVYSLTPAVAGCNPQTVTTNPSGGSKAVAIVDAYNYPTALTDLQYFSTQFGLPAPNLTVVYANGVPGTNSGWALEAALDLQWVHAMAPSAKLYLVLARNSSLSELLRAVDTASALVAAAGGGEVSMSWGGSEFSYESLYDSHFKTPNVVYLAASGDSAGTLWPSTSPYVVGVGGTTISRNSTTGAFLQETAWSDTGGGPSRYYSRPSYQNAIAAKVGSKRGSPDVAMAANPNTGGWVYDSSSYGYVGWWIVGGTSWSVQTFAGIVNAAGHFAASSTAELTTLYAGLGSANFRDITLGSCGPYASYLAVAGWDFCTGVGSDLGYAGK